MLAIDAQVSPHLEIWVVQRRFPHLVAIFGLAVVVAHELGLDALVVDVSAAWGYVLSQMPINRHHEIDVRAFIVVCVGAHAMFAKATPSRDALIRLVHIRREPNNDLLVHLVEPSFNFVDSSHPTIFRAAQHSGSTSSPERVQNPWEGHRVWLSNYWPGPVHEGNGKMQLIVDENADDAQT